MRLRTIEERLYEDAVNKLRSRMQSAARTFESLLCLDLEGSCNIGVFDADGNALSMPQLLRHLVERGIKANELYAKSQAVSDFMDKVLNPREPQ